MNTCMHVNLNPEHTHTHTYMHVSKIESTTLPVVQNAEQTRACTTVPTSPTTQTHPHRDNVNAAVMRPIGRAPTQTTRRRNSRSNSYQHVRMAIRLAWGRTVNLDVNVNLSGTSIRDGCLDQPPRGHSQPSPPAQSEHSAPRRRCPPHPSRTPHAPRCRPTQTPPRDGSMCRRRGFPLGHRRPGTR